MTWLIARTATNFENRVTEHLLVRFSTESYSPRYREPIIDRRSRRKRFLTRRLYPCYLFVKKNPILRLLDIDGIVRVLFPLENLIEDKIAELRSCEDADGFVPKPEAKQKQLIHLGDTIVVMRGLLKGRAGICSEYVDATDVEVLFDIFGRKVPLRYCETDLAAA